MSRRPKLVAHTKLRRARYRRERAGRMLTNRWLWLAVLAALLLWAVCG